MNTVEQIYMFNRTRPFAGESRRIRAVKPLRDSILDHRGGPAIIAEFKRKSPSGFSNEVNLDINAYLRKVVSIDPVGLSILTEPLYFSGSMEDITVAHQFDIPVLAKDFISDRNMIVSAFNSGADTVLLIADFLDKTSIANLTIAANELGMDVLIEFHDRDAMDRIPNIREKTVGYNRRNLRNMKIEDNTDRILRDIAKFEGPKVLESGLDFRHIPKEYLESFDAFLIGTSLLSSAEVIS